MENWKGMIYNNVDYSKYFKISTLGNVYSEYRKRLIKPQINKHGYYRFVTRINKKPINFGIHRAVACTFIPNLDNLPEINHKDGNKLNNEVSNLEWCTSKYNINHAMNSGLNAKYGENNASAKLNKSDVEFIKLNYIPYDKNYSATALSKRFGVSKTTILNIVHNITWRTML